MFEILEIAEKSIIPNSTQRHFQRVHLRPSSSDDASVAERRIEGWGGSRQTSRLTPALWVTLPSTTGSRWAVFEGGGFSYLDF